jgi:hypothetical protein
MKHTPEGNQGKKGSKPEHRSKTSGSLQSRPALSMTSIKMINIQHTKLETYGG